MSRLNQVFITVLLGGFIAQPVLAVDMDLDLVLLGVYNNNVTEAAAGLETSSALGRSILDIGLNWKTSGNDKVFFKISGDTEHFLKTTIPGNTKLVLKPGYRFALFNEALETTVSYRLTKNWRHLISSNTLSSSRRGTAITTDIPTYEDLSSDPYLSHRGQISSDYSRDKWRLGGWFDYDRKLYSTSDRRDSCFGTGGNLGLSPSNRVGLDLSAGYEQNSSNLSGSSYFGPFIQGLVIFQFTNSFSGTTLYRYALRNYGADGVERNRMLVVDFEFELSASTSLEAELVRTNNSSSDALSSFQTMEYSSGVAFHF